MKSSTWPNSWNRTSASPTPMCAGEPSAGRGNIVTSIVTAGGNGARGRVRRIGLDEVHEADRARHLAVPVPRVPQARPELLAGRVVDQRERPHVLVPAHPAGSLLDPDPEHLAGKAEQPVGDGVDGQVRPHRLAIHADRPREGVDPGELVPRLEGVALQLVREDGAARVDERRGGRPGGTGHPFENRLGGPDRAHGARRRAQRGPRLEPRQTGDLPPRREQLAHRLEARREPAVLERAPEPLAEAAVADLGEEGVARLVVDRHADGARRAGLEPGDHLGGEPVERLRPDLEVREIVGERRRHHDRQLGRAPDQPLELRATGIVQVGAVDPLARSPQRQVAGLGPGSAASSMAASTPNRSRRAKVRLRHAS